MSTEATPTPATTTPKPEKPKRKPREVCTERGTTPRGQGPVKEEAKGAAAAQG